MAIKPGTICPMRTFTVATPQMQKTFKPLQGKNRYVFLYLGLETDNEHIDIDGAMKKLGYIGGEPSAHADKGVLNWVDGQQFQEERFLYKGPPIDPRRRIEEQDEDDGDEGSA